jgi:hypothetical protein
MVNAKQNKINKTKPIEKVVNAEKFINGITGSSDL